MAHQIEYLLDIDHSVIKTWLSCINGSLHNSESVEGLTIGDFEMWNGLILCLEIASTASRLSFPQLIYSHFLFAGPVISSWVEQIEEHLCQELIGVPIIRVDELLFGEWERANGREWWQIPRPLDSLRKWLVESWDDARYYRVFGAVEKYI